MKKSRLGFILAIGALLASCGNTPTISSIEKAPDSSSQPSSVTEESSSSLISSSDFSSSPWGQEAASACYGALSYVIPYLENNEFTYEVGVDDYGDPMIEFFLYYDTDELAESAFNKYAEVCAYQNGFTVNIGEQTYIDYDTYTYYTYDVAVADLRVQEFLGVELFWTASTKNGKPCLGIFCYTYLYIDPNIYPELAVTTLLGEKHKIPQVVGEGYTYKFFFFIDESGNKGLEIQVYGCDYEIEEEYFNAMIDKGCWSIVDNDEESLNYYEEYPGYDIWTYYYAIHDFKNLMVCFQYSYDYGGFIIDILQY